MTQLTAAKIQKKAALHLRERVDSIVRDFGPFWAESVVGHAASTRNACEQVLDQIGRMLPGIGTSRDDATTTFKSDVMSPLEGLRATAEEVGLRLEEVVEEQAATRSCAPTPEAAEELSLLFSGIRDVQRKMNKTSPLSTNP